MRLKVIIFTFFFSYLMLEHLIRLSIQMFHSANTKQQRSSFLDFSQGFYDLKNKEQQDLNN